MYFVLLVAALAILGGVVVVAMGHGGQIAYFRRDEPILAVRFRTPDEVALAKLPIGLFGYQLQATGDALAAAAALVDERDAEIAGLRAEVLRLRGDSEVAAVAAVTAVAGAGAPAGDPVDQAGPATIPASDAEPAGGVGAETDPAAGLTVEPRWRQ